MSIHGRYRLPLEGDGGKEGVQSPGGPAHAKERASWMYSIAPLTALSLLSLSSFAGPAVSPYHLALLAVVAAAVLFVVGSRGVTTEQVGRRHLALYFVILMNVFFINIVPAGAILEGYVLVDLVGAAGVAVFAVWAVRNVRYGALKMVRSPVDAAVLLLSAITSVLFFGLYLLLRLNSLPVALNFSLLKVVLLSGFIYSVMRGSLHTDTSLRRFLRFLLLAPSFACLWAIVSLFVS